MSIPLLCALVGVLYRHKVTSDPPFEICIIIIIPVFQHYRMSLIKGYILCNWNLSPNLFDFKDQSFPKVSYCP